MKNRGFEVNGDSLGDNPVVSSEDVVKSPSGGRFLTEDEVLKRADEVRERQKTAKSEGWRG